MNDLQREDNADRIRLEAAGFSNLRPIRAARRWGGILAVVLLCAAYFPVLDTWVKIARSSDLHSHVILIPIVSIYLLATGRSELEWDFEVSPVSGGLMVLLSALVAGWLVMDCPGWSDVDLLAARLAAFVGLLWGIGWAFMGGRWMRSAMFPMMFLFFMIPLPDSAVEHLERFLIMMSARSAEILFSIGDIPVFRTGQVLELPGIVLEVAQECSGIRSSWFFFHH